MPDLPDQLASPQTAATFLTTEHFVLQTARAATIAEANGRASVYLGVVSGALVALGFAGQAGPGHRVLLGFGLALFPVLLFLGVATYARVLQLSLEDIVLLWRIDRIRRLYLDANPKLGGILAPAWSQGPQVPRYARRAQHGAEDAALVVGTGKDLLEATACHILRERGVPYDPAKLRFPALLSTAFVALHMTIPDIAPGRVNSPAAA